MQTHARPQSSRVRAPVLARYEVVGHLGSGAMASVYLARKIGAGSFRKWVALKRIHPHLRDDPSFVRMFLDEASILAALSHPNVAQIFDLAEEQGTYWMVMEYLHGVSLSEIVRRAKEIGQHVPRELACRVVAEAAEGLHAAHDLRADGSAVGLVHRDVSPHNLFVTYDGHVKVVDFGVARYATGGSTRAGVLKGKLAYMSPEQAGGGTVDRRTDVFALGVVLWELTTGRRLFREESDMATLARVQDCEVPPPSEIAPGYPPELERIVLKALSKEKEARFATARELSRALFTLVVGRRENVVLADALSSYVRSIFAERMQERELLLHGHAPSLHASTDALGDEPTVVTAPAFEDETTVTRLTPKRDDAYSAPPLPMPPRIHTSPWLPPVVVAPFRNDSTTRIPTRKGARSPSVLAWTSAGLLVLAVLVLALALTLR